MWNMEKWSEKVDLLSSFCYGGSTDVEGQCLPYYGWLFPLPVITLDTTVIQRGLGWPGSHVEWPCPSQASESSQMIEWLFHLVRLIRHPLASLIMMCQWK